LTIHPRHDSFAFSIAREATSFNGKYVPEGAVFRRLLTIIIVQSLSPDQLLHEAGNF
jgi:hypothetical protein